MKEMINDWRPETRSLISALQEAGFVIKGGNNGENQFVYDDRLPMNEFLKDLLACDEAWMDITTPSGKDTYLFLVLGNSPGEMVSDYGVPRDKADAELLDKVTSAHYDKWNGRKQPMRPSPYRQ